MLKCATCGKFISSNASASCGVCPSVYHKACVSLPDTAPVSREWACPDCKNKAPKDDNISSAGQVKSYKEEVIDEIRKMQDGVSEELRSLKSEVRSLCTELKEVRREMSDFRECVTGVNARMDGLEARLDAVERQRAAEPEPSSALADLQATVCRLQRELAERDQDALLADLEIGHLPEERGESVLHAVTVLAAKLGVPLEERDVVFAERVGVAQGAAAAGQRAPPRRVVVRLARHDLRDQLLQGARVRRTLTAADAGRAPAPAPDAAQRIYVNERLTRLNRHLFFRVREECRRAQWRFAWTKRGRVYARQADGKPAYPIRSEDDVARVFGVSPDNNPRFRSAACFSLQVVSGFISSRFIVQR